MIIDKLENIRDYDHISNKFRLGFDFLLNTDFDEFPEGKHPIDGNNIFAIFSTYMTQKETEISFEAHKKYIDIQYIVQGREIIYWSPVKDLTGDGEYSEKNDVIFFKGENTIGLRMQENYFSIFFSQDAHKPGCISGKPEQVKKVVVKVLI